MQMASMLASSTAMSGNSLATSVAVSRNSPSVARTTLALWTMVTFLRPYSARELERGPDDALRARPGC